MAETTTAPTATEAGPRRRLFTADEFERMAEFGILGDDERVELIDGEVIATGRVSSPHAACVTRVTVAFGPQLDHRALIRIRGPIRLADASEPIPDISIVLFKDDFYASAHPGSADVFLVIEVMDTSAAYDRGKKLPLYAAAGIPETWLIDLVGQAVEVYRQPVGGQYAEKQTYRRGQSVAPAAFPDLVLAVDSILTRTLA